MRKSQVGALPGIQRLRLTYYIVWMEDSYGVQESFQVYFLLEWLIWFTLRIVNALVVEKLKNYKE